MKFLNYCRYFFYIALNWNIRLAFFVILHEVRGEKKYGLTTTGYDELKKLKKKGIDISHATLYMPVSYFLLEKIFNELHPTARAHFTDIGCGRGRTLCVAAFKGFKKVSGIDFSEELCAEAKRNLEQTRRQVPVLEYSVAAVNATAYYIPPDVDHLFFFNPFDADIMKEVVAHISLSLRKNPRPLTVIYVNPLYKELFINAGFTETYHFSKMHYLEFVLLNVADK